MTELWTSTNILEERFEHSYTFGDTRNGGKIQLKMQNQTHRLLISSSIYIIQTKVAHNFLLRKETFSFEKKIRNEPFSLKLSSQANFHLQSQFL